MSEQQQLMQARQLIADQQYDAAKAILRELPDNATAQQWLAKLENAPSSETKAKLLEAQALIKQKQFAEARALLTELGDNATAQKWLAQIDQVAPPPAPVVNDALDALFDTPAEAPAATPITPLGDAPVAPLTGTPTPIRDPGDRPVADPAVTDSLRASVDTDENDSRREQVEQVVGQVTDQVTSALIAANVDLGVGGVALVVAAVTGLLAALLDRILGMPGILLFTFGGFAALINGPVYARIVQQNAKRKQVNAPTATIELAAMLVAAAAGLVAGLVWFIVSAIILGSPDYNDPGDVNSHNIYRSWFDEYANFFKALITGPVLGLMGLGWHWLVPHLPGDMTRLQAMIPQRGGGDDEV